MTSKSQLNGHKIYLLYKIISSTSDGVGGGRERWRSKTRGQRAVGGNI